MFTRFLFINNCKWTWRKPLTLQEWQWTYLTWDSLQRSASMSQAVVLVHVRRFRDVFSSLKQFLSSWRQNSTVLSSHIQGQLWWQRGHCFCPRLTFYLFFFQCPYICLWGQEGGLEWGGGGLCGPARGRTLRNNTNTIIYNTTQLSIIYKEITSKTALEHSRLLLSCSAHLHPSPRGNLAITVM